MSQLASKRRKPTFTRIPRAYQIRLGGAKGMLSVDYRLEPEGRVVCLRPSMTKFDSLSTHIEIAQSFDKPSPMYLNRPLIMLLEGLGVNAGVFLRLQRDAVANTKAAVEEIGSAAGMLEGCGLGSSFRLPSVFLSLKKLGCNFKGVDPDNLIADEFTSRLLTFAVNHALRELKHHARIPVPRSWTLVGIADVHSFLKEGQIFACVTPSGSNKRIYISGRCLITRSPVIHPGDVQLVHAIGVPPEGSPYARDPLDNTVVFSALGMDSMG